MKTTSLIGSDTKPPVFRFTARLVQSIELAKPVVNLPVAVGKKLDGMTTLEGTVNDHPFRAALERTESGNVFVRVNAAMLKGARADIGDMVYLAVLGPEPRLTVPADLRAAFTDEARTLWKELTPLGRRDWVRWIESAKNPETRARRITRTVEQLSEGKRRPCCVNFYEYMLQYVRE